ncbi:FxsB family cyclophane-forming radical SAM/SPASM peptide maturase [Cryptosporangium arvum]|uniref:FxsB family cyclophane-forming radical SAM/SPASM peptide maturase n=1 Tax=Cryptosporangium arvum TaxID=80871 RepID=UPI001B80A4CE|nr:FxsB family cyclophane-forming radical SAM/SPASM peptide maturase [Cryptosporangium arvum]
MASENWRPVPISQFILKLTSRCNLNCDYCYIFNKADKAWQDRPHRMSDATVDAIGARIGQHADAHGLSRVEAIIHGGEPMLYGPDALLHALDSIEQHLPAGTELDASVQTNGVLLDGTVLDTLLAHGIRVGVSMDGTRTAHDRHRRFPDGRPSFGIVERNLRRLGEPKYRSIYAGLLCVVDLEQDPIATYQQLAEFSPPRIDFLLPHGDWNSRPPGRPDDDTTPYADWLSAIFDRWFTQPGPRPGIRLFEEILQLLLGGHSRSENIGLSPVATLVIETDGSIQQIDSLRNAYPGAAETGMHVGTHLIDDALRHPGVVARQLGIDALADACRSCRFGRTCGGGAYPTRYRAGAGFQNRSVYCPDLFALIEHVRGAVVHQLRDHQEQN